MNSTHKDFDSYYHDPCNPNPTVCTEFPQYSYPNDDYVTGERLYNRRNTINLISTVLNYGPQANIDDHELFGSELNLKAYRQSIFVKKSRNVIFQQVVKMPKRVGFRHFILIALLALYSAVGGLIFLQFERPAQLKALSKADVEASTVIKNYTDKIFNVLSINGTKEQWIEVQSLLGQAIDERLLIEGEFIGTKLTHAMHQTWTYSSAVFFAMSLFTTIGYGTPAPRTVAGKTTAVIYALVGIPLMLVVLSDVGKILLKYFTHSYNICRRLYHKFQKQFGDQMKPIEKYEKLEDSDFPLSLLIILVVLYLLVTATVVCVFDYHSGNDPGLDMGNAIYFSFVSMSTIGLGDIMPNNIEYSPFLAIMFLFGLALLGVVNSTVYEQMEEGFLRLIDTIEQWLEACVTKRDNRVGYGTFKTIKENIQLLALALPLFDDIDTDVKDQIATVRIRHRTRSLDFSDLAKLHSYLTIERRKTLDVAELSHIRPHLIAECERKRAATCLNHHPVAHRVRSEKIKRIRSKILGQQRLVTRKSITNHSV